MNIALRTSPIHWSVMSSLLRWTTPKTAANTENAPMVIHPCERLPEQAHTRTGSANPVAHKPLRVVRWMDADQPPSQVGRMVISGRMADVCAELDRLVAREAAMH